jgi:hypothetical protein
MLVIQQDCVIDRRTLQDSRASAADSEQCGEGGFRSTMPPSAFHSNI